MPFCFLIFGSVMLFQSFIMYYRWHCPTPQSLLSFSEWDLPSFSVTFLGTELQRLLTPFQFKMHIKFLTVHSSPNIFLIKLLIWNNYWSTGSCKVAQRGPMYPPPSFSQWLHYLIIVWYQNLEFWYCHNLCL